MRADSFHRRLHLGLALAICGVIWGAAWWVDRGDRTITVEVTCAGEQCTARVGDAVLKTTRVRRSAEAHSIGLYLYHPYEFDRPQYFRRLRLESPTRPGEFVERLLVDPGWEDGWAADRGWQVRPGRGLTHEGDLGVRSVAMLNSFEASDFTASVELDSSVDAGLIVRATDQDNGTVLVVRARHNDAYLFDLDQGEPGPISQFGSLLPLHMGREALRLAGLLARLLSTGLVAVWVLRRLAVLGRRLPVPGLARWLSRDRAPRGLVVGLALAALLVLAAVAWFGLGGVPHVADETAYLFQAKIFAGGAAWAQSPAPPDFFRHEHVVIDGDRWYAKYPPMFSLLLAAGVLAGLPWLVNPVLGALALVGTFFLARELAGWRWAVGAALLTLTSPFFIVMGGTMMSHMACAALVTWLLYFVVRGLTRGEPAWGAAAGACLGLTIWTRPFTALLVAVAAGLHGLVCLRRASERRRVAAFGLLAAAVTLPFAVGFVAWNGLQMGNGSGLSVGHYGVYDGADTLGFGPDKGRGWLMTWGSWGHTPAKALRSVEQYLDYTSRHLLGWPLRLSFALVIGAFMLRRRTGFEGLLLAVFLSLAAGHMLYWATQHIAYGARYWFSALPGLMVLATLGLRGIASERKSADSAASPAAWCSGVAVALLIGWNLTVYLPGRLAELPKYAGVSADLKREIDRRGFERGIVFVETEGLLYNDGFFMNDPFQRNELLFVRDLGERNREIIEQYADRPAYRWSRGRLVPLNRTTRASVPRVEASTAAPPREQP